MQTSAINLRSKLLLLRRDGAFAWTDRGLGGQLPEITIPVGSRYASSITQSLRKEFELDAIYLWGSNLPHMNGETLPALEIRPPFRLPDPWIWVTPSQLENVARREELEDIQEILRYTTVGSPDCPFVKLGWFDELWGWIKEATSGASFELTGSYSQSNGGRAFLARFETTNCALWFKAPGSKSPYEHEITSQLAVAAPEWLPEIIAIHSDWRGWLCKEMGHSLYEASNFVEYRLAAKGLAQLQAHAQPLTDWLLSIGAQDQRTEALYARVPCFISMVSHLMKMQPVTTPAVMTDVELEQLGERLKAALIALRETGFPDSIIHGDISPGSIVCDGERCVFIDWSRVYVGFAPICCELMLNKFSPLLGDHPGWRTKLWEEYLGQWSNYKYALSGAVQTASLALVALLAYVLTKVDVATWRPSVDGHECAYIRSLARRMGSLAIVSPGARTKGEEND
jgi:hypothetical protein